LDLWNLLGRSDPLGQPRQSRHLALSNLRDQSDLLAQSDQLGQPHQLRHLAPSNLPGLSNPLDPPHRSAPSQDDEYLILVHLELR
jgi:hypothetical protein